MSAPQTQDPGPVPHVATPARKSRFRFWQCFWLTFLVVSLGYAWYCFYAPSNNIAWADDHRRATQRAVESNKQIILYFTGTWCVPCRIMKRQVWADQRVAALVNEHFVPVAIDVDNPDHGELMKLYKVSGPPVTIVTDPQGNVLGWRAGGIGKAAFLEFLEEVDQSSGKEDQ